MTAVAVGVSLSDVYGSFTRMVQTLDFTTIRRAPKEYHWYCDNARTGKHISLTECFVISADVDSGEDKIFICFSNLWSLLSIARQINSGWDFVWHGDATFNFCRADAGLITLGHNSLGAHYQNLCWTIMGGSRETKQTYEQSYEARFEAVCLGGDNDCAWDPTMEDMITLSESFHLCVAVPRKWAPEVRHKCSCEHFAKEAYCKHVVLLAMLMDPTVKPPAEDDIRVINQRKASKQRRAQKRQLVGDEEEPVVRKKPKDPPRPEPLLRPSRPENSEKAQG